MARNKFLTTIASLVNHKSNRRKSQFKKGSEGFVYRQKSDGIKYFTHLYQALVSFTKQLTGHHPSKRWRRFFQHKLGKSFLRLLEAIGQFGHRFTVKVFYRLWSNFLLAYRQRAQAGFVLPVTVLMVVVMLLVVTSLMFRAGQRSQQVIGDYQLQQLKNSATPAIERAKAKIELLFSDEPGGVYNVTSGIPAESLMEQLLGDDTYYRFTSTSPTFSDEQRLTNITPQGTLNGSIAAWSFQTDNDGDGDYDTTTAYAILVRSTRADGSTLRTMDHRLAESDTTGTYEELPDATNNNTNGRDDYFVVNNGPVLPASSDSACQPRFDSEETDASNTFVQGWFQVGGGDAVLKKNIQVYAVSIPNNGNRVISTGQYQQDRSFSRANKWGAWFRTDIEINPGGGFDWNGAIHTEGSLYIRGNRAFNGNLISEQQSCFFNPKLNSDITVGGHLVYSLMTQVRNNLNGAVNIELYPDESTTALTADTSSTALPNSPIDISIDPEAVLLRNQSVPRVNGVWDQATVTAEWPNSELATNRVAVLQSGQQPPYIDDTYRADNLYGPKVAYDGDVNTPECQMGQLIGDVCTVVTPSVNQVINNETPDAVLQPDEYGLDGYWERRARGQGTRIIVGQRLELGNAFGWVQDLSTPRNGSVTDTEDKGHGADPLNPPDGTIANANMNNRPHELRQRRTQYDNLAAVQATTVYHYSDGSVGYDPIAVVATTVHPGTENTLKNSATFDTITFNDSSGTAQTPIAIDFFNGYGTNGWEFAPPDVTNIGSSSALGKALRNLAYFAGDTGGAYPPTQEAGRVHPYPQLTMWGNFSNLRKIFDNNAAIVLPSSGGAGNVSIADASTIHTAAATLGMLAYNIDYLQSYDYEKNKNSGLGDGITNLGNALWKLQDGDINNGEVIDPVGTDATDYDLPPDAYLAALERDKNDLTSDGITNIDEVIKLARLVMTKEQVKRDRTYGFLVSPENHPGNDPFPELNLYSINQQGSGPEPIDNDTPPLAIACDVSDSNSSGTGNNYFGLGNPADATVERQFIGLSRLCSNEPKFPALYYVFPQVDHAHGGGTDDVDGVSNINHTQPADEPYITDTYIAGINNNANQYTAITDTEIGNNIAIQPRQVDGSDWILIDNTRGPATPTNNTAAPNDSQQELVNVNGTNFQVPIKDSALFDGREEMSVRVLNLDINMLRSVSPPGDNTETWLPNSGVIYAFREDAMREDGIARPPGTQMNAFTPSDPTLDANGMTTKSIDYYADPDRRAYGFRLKNGADLRRQPGGALNTSILRGVTFVSDNPVYIQGDFNLHTSNGSNTLTELVGGNLDPNFADPEVDYWRPAEILGDAVSVLSNNFCDGSVEDGYLYTAGNTNNLNLTNTLRDRYGCQAGVRQTSYINQGRPEQNPAPTWARVNPWEDPTASPESPILIDNDGEASVITTTTTTPYNPDATYNQDYYTFVDRGQNGGRWAENNLLDADNTTTNLVMIGGIVPAQQNQNNGGLINFPRMLEDWVSAPRPTLSIQGSFIQLNFSNYATGAFDHDAWEPGTNPNGNQQEKHYRPPIRQWGYDVGLQYLPAGPVARRIVIPGTERSEFYREPEADDPYICKLREAIGFSCN